MLIALMWSLIRGKLNARHALHTVGRTTLSAVRRHVSSCRFFCVAAIRQRLTASRGQAPRGKGRRSAPRTLDKRSAAPPHGKRGHSIARRGGAGTRQIQGTRGSRHNQSNGDSRAEGGGVDREVCPIATLDCMMAVIMMGTHYVGCAAHEARRPPCSCGLHPGLHHLCPRWCSCLQQWRCRRLSSSSCSWVCCC